MESRRLVFDGEIAQLDRVTSHLNWVTVIFGFAIHLGTVTECEEEGRGKSAVGQHRNQAVGID